MTTEQSGWLSRLARLWCVVMHDDITLPRNGRYRCRICRREYPVTWDRNPSVSNFRVQAPSR
jgi:hypothetical protein